METTTKTDWYCACGTYNKAAWGVCPVCEKRREDLAGPTAQQRAEQRHAAVAGVKQATSSTFYGVVGLVVALAVLAGLAFGGWKGWQYAEERWFSDDKQTEATPDRLPTDQELLAKHFVPPGKPYVPQPVPTRLQVDGAWSPAERKAMGYQAGLSRLWLDPATKREVLTIVVEFDSNRLAEARVRSVAKHFFTVPTRAFRTKLPSSVGLTATKRDADGHHVSAITIIRGTRLAWVGLATPRPATKADIKQLNDLATKQYSHL